MSIKGSGLRTGHLAPHLVVAGVLEAMRFYREAFGASEVYRSPLPQGGGYHGQMRIGDALIMLTDESPDPEIRKSHASPGTLGGTPVTLQIYVRDVDAVFASAIKAGAKELLKPHDAFFGDRFSMILDPFGHAWAIVQILEEVALDDLDARVQLEALAHGAE